MPLAFGPFELDLDGCALTRAGRAVALERRPTELLCLLASRPGELVGRRELADRIWGAVSDVDADMGINTAIRKIRVALGDLPGAIRHVETVQGRGYRFIAPVSAAPKRPWPEATLAAAAATIAVLPFDLIVAAGDHDYIAAGFTDELIATLGHVDPDTIRVVGSRSAQRYRGSAASLCDIGVALGASHLVTGAIRIEGQSLRVTVKLIHAPDEHQIWSAAFDGAQGHLLGFQQNVGAQAAARVRRHLSPGAPPRALSRHTADEAAYDAYLRGRHCWNRNQSRSNQQAIDFFLRATALDPTYALAWSGLADTYSSSPINSDVPAAAIWRQAREAASAAIVAGPDLAEAHASLGFVRFWLDWDWIEAERCFQRAAVLDPNYAFAFRMIGIVSSHLGWHDAARSAMARAVALDPLFAMHHALSAVAAFHAGRFEEAARFARDAIEVDPQFWIGHFQLAQALDRIAGPDETIAVLDEAARHCGNSSKPAMLRGYVLARAGRRREAEAQLAALRQAASSRFVPPYACALIQAGLGERESAFASLEQALAVRDVNLAFLPRDPKWRDFAGDTGFVSLLDRCGFTQPPRHELPVGQALVNLQTVFRSAPWSRPARAS